MAVVVVLVVPLEVAMGLMVLCVYPGLCVYGYVCSSDHLRKWVQAHGASVQI